jgi:predicted ATPase
MGQTEEGLQMVDEALAVVGRTGERFYEAELYRLRGELTLQKEARGWRLETSSSSPQASSLKSPVSQGVEREAEECFLKAIEIAQKQQAKSLELRAVMSLVRLRQQQTARHATRVGLDEAHQMLPEVYHWFTEGFETADLKDAQALLDELS